MKNIKNTIYVIVVLILGSFTLSSCLIDDFETDFGKGPILVQFENIVDELNIIKDAENTPIDYVIPITYFGGKGVALDKDLQVTIAVSAASVAKEGVEFELNSTTVTIPAGEKVASISIKVLTGALVPFEFKDVILEITDSSESVSENSTITLTLKALDENTLAGVYDVVDGQYWNSGTYRGDFNGRTMTIEAISPNVYRHIGLALWPNNSFHFTVDENTGIITVMKTDLDGVPTLLNGSPIMTCAGGKFEMIPCDDTVSKSTLMADGHHVVEITTGYYRGTGATREFYTKMVRQ